MSEGEKLLRHAASLGPEAGMLHLSRTFSGADGHLVRDFIVAAQSFKDPETGEFRADAPDDIVALGEAARESLLG